ncbi:CRISPR-associated protein Cas5 [Deinococcus sp. Leaf326]|jgi:CRISPR-associated protein Cas5d|uniref:CRISPR-associated protein Cas5 n=1 Tax=Deinococcus sp. Leaf326 TaxID=1736338 RepID=UPI0009E83013|nr:CRISPR-associated protein Cas5 [Deinococcus sp. Leaf326]
MNSPPIGIRAWGKSASFTRYDTPTERDTYPMLTVPAADGVLTSIYWQPGLRYKILAN